MYCLYLTVLLVLLDGRLAQPTTCKDLGKVPIDFESNFIGNNPFTIFWSSSLPKIFHCNQLAFIYPQTGDTGFNFSAIFTNGPVATRLQVRLIDGSVWDTSACNSGAPNGIFTFYAKFDGTNNAFCAAACGTGGSTFAIVFCAGKSPEDKKLLKQQLDQYGISVVDAQLACNLKDKVCAAIDQGIKTVSNIISPLT